MTAAPELSAELLRGVAALWKKTNRELAVRFGGKSMRPTIEPGQEVMLGCTDDVAIGDVIVYVYLDQVVVHRLVARGNGWLLTRGDAHTNPDLPIAPDAVVGKLAGVAGPPRSLARAASMAVVRVAALFGVGVLRIVIRALQFAARLAS